jgi:hypothetical protein
VVISGNNLPNSSDLVTTDSTQTLTNKTIDGDDNTVKNLSLTSLKTDLPNANKVIRRDSSGAVVSDNNIPNSSDLVTVDATQTLTNKTIDGDDNTVQDLALTSLKTDLPNANKVIRRDASGVVISGNNLPNASDLVTVDSTQTLTNKTIDGDDNTIQDLSLTSLKTDLPNANKVIRRDASGVVVSGNNLPNSSDIVTIDASQVITNKDIDGGTASNSSRITLPKNTRTNLNALTRKEGTLVYDTDGDKVLYDDGINLKELGSGGGELNFLQLANASWDGENGTAGFVTYKDAAQSRPQDGIGGSPSVGITTSNTNPLSGNNSLIIDKPSGNYQGEGVSVNFAIDRASRARVLKIEFDYIVNSGTFNAGTNTADSDLIVYIYDADANQLIEPSTFKLYANATNIADRFSGYFQTSAASTNYRLIFHVATTNSSAWSLKVDNVVVAPSKYVYGTPITDWVEYTPQLLGSVTNPTIGTNGYVRGRWRRVGDTAEIQATAYRGTSGGTAGSGDYYLTMPSGMVADFQKTIMRGNVGTGYVLDNPVLNYTGVAFLTADGTKLSVVLDQYGNLIGSSIPSANWWTSAGDNTFEIRASIPIQGWSSSVKMSDGYDGRMVAASYNATTSGTLINNTPIFIDFDNRLYDTTSSVVGAGSGNNTNWQNTWRYIAPVSGLYSINSTVTVVFPANTLVDAIIGVAVNGTQVRRGNRSVYVTPSIPENRALVVACDIWVNAGDAISIFVDQGSGGNRSMGTPTTIANAVSIHRISSPQTIAMGESINVVATNSSGQTLPNGSLTTLTGWTKEKDTHNAFNASTGIFTAPVSGLYEFSLMLTLNSAANNVGGEFSAVLASGHGKIAATFAQASGTYFMTITGSKTIYLNAGQTTSITGYVGGLGGSRNLYANSDFNWLSIKRVGN